jgi:hypothetical protein
MKTRNKTARRDKLTMDMQARMSYWAERAVGEGASARKAMNHYTRLWIKTFIYRTTGKFKIHAPKWEASNDDSINNDDGLSVAVHDSGLVSTDSVQPD